MDDHAIVPPWGLESTLDRRAMLRLLGASLLPVLPMSAFDSKGSRAVHPPANVAMSVSQAKPRSRSFLYKRRI
jgi:hypothetical protein